jgi:hypothetical protein
VGFQTRPSSLMGLDVRLDSGPADEFDGCLDSPRPLGFSSSSTGVRAGSVCPSTSRASARYERTGRFPLEQLQPAAHGMHAIFTNMAFRR